MKIQNYRTSFIKNKKSVNTILHYNNFIEKGFGELFNIWKCDVVTVMKNIEQEFNKLPKGCKMEEFAHNTLYLYFCIFE